MSYDSITTQKADTFAELAATIESNSDEHERRAIWREARVAAERAVQYERKRAERILRKAYRGV